VLEVGVGAGAFAEVILQSFPEISAFVGMDYSIPAVEIANSRLCKDAGKDAKFKAVAGNALQVQALMANEEKFDVVVSFGLTQYLESVTTVDAWLEQMVSVLKPGGRMYIGEVNDEAKKAEALAIRATSHKKASPDHLYLMSAGPATVWKQVRGVSNLSIVQHTDLGLTYPTASYRYSAYLTKQ
jgi:ubiquinone/menaquinone biosynthesis C-methylase UbiE